jgi:N-acetyl-alpha-D-glucosaminyl L-malate synthase BshA
MKIAILLWRFLPRYIGGAEIATYNIAKYLAKRGHEVHIITSSESGILNQEQQNFYIHTIKRGKVRFIRFLPFLIRILAVLRKIKPDIIHAQTIGMGIVGFLAKKFFKIPYIVYGRGSEVYLSWPLKNQVSKLVFRHADAVIALTEDMKKLLQRFCNREVYVIPNGIELDRFSNLPKKEEVLSKIGIDKQENVIIFVGRLCYVKGVKYLIQAMNIITKENRKVKLLIIGDGEERQNLENFVKELNLENNVIFLGNFHNEKIPEYMSASDIFVLPSLSEGFPVVILEAMACGLPIVATNVGGIPYIIKERENGFLVMPKNAEQIAEKVLYLIENKNILKEISENNKERVKDYNLNNVVEKLEKIYFYVKNKS